MRVLARTCEAAVIAEAGAASVAPLAEFERSRLAKPLSADEARSLTVSRARLPS